MSEKDGLDSAVDTTKLVVTLDGAMIAFITGASFLEYVVTTAERYVILIAIVLLGFSLIGGMLVLFESGTMYSAKSYDLSSKWIKYPGIVNLFGFALGSLCVGALATGTLIFGDVPTEPAQQSWKLKCQVSKSEALECFIMSSSNKSST
jgi:hypothetical protein